MNRPGLGPNPMRGMAGAYPNQQQLPQSRSSSTAGRLPNNKMASNGASWGYPNGGPVSSAQGARQNLAPITSFAQSIGGSQPATPLDLSDFPTLSNNNAHQVSSNQIPQSLWASSTTARNLAQPSGQRPGQSNLILGHQNQSHQQSQQDDLFASSSQLPSSQGVFRFGTHNPHNSVGQSVISQQGPADEFPPLNRNGNGEIGHSVVQIPNSMFGGQASGSAFSPAIGGTHSQQANGLLNQLTNSRAPSAGRTDSPGGLQGLLAASSRLAKSHAAGTMDNDMGAFSRPSQTPSQNNYRDQLGQPAGSGPPLLQNDLHNELYRAFGGDMPRQEVAPRPREFSGPGAAPENNEQLSEDPTAGMSDLDRFGIKGLLSILKGPYQDQATLMTGIDPNSLGIDPNAPERISESLWSVFDDQPPRPDVPFEGGFEIPDCYIVHNVQPIENKIPNFSDETLFMLFYQNVGSVQQVDAARELASRNWRYHKKFQVWLTKDNSVQPIQISQSTERGFYIFWNPKVWEREKREFQLNYADLEINDS